MTKSFYQSLGNKFQENSRKHFLTNRHCVAYLFSPIFFVILQVAADSRKFDGEDIALATGILSAMKKFEFVFMLVYMREFLNLISPADKILQSRDVGFREAMPVINTVITEVRKLREPASFDKIWNRSEEILNKHDVYYSNASRPLRTKKRPSALASFFITDPIGERNTDVKVEIKSAYFEVIDIFLSEMKHRFEENSDILLAISDANELSIEKLQPLKRLGISLPLEPELIVAKSYLDRRRQEHDDERKKRDENDFKGLFNELLELYTMREAFPNVYKLMATIDTFGCSSTICECSFSALDRVGDKTRLNMSDERLRQLSFLAFEYKRLRNLSVDLVLKRFNDNPKRRVQIY